MKPSGSILKRSPAPATRASMRSSLIFALAGSALLPSVVNAQNFEPAGRENGARVAVDRSVTFQRDDGSTHASLIEVPRQTSGRRYALVAADFDCANGRRTVFSRTEFSTRRDPIQTVFDPPLVVDAAASPAVAEQARVVCGSRARVGSVTLREFVGPPR